MQSVGAATERPTPVDDAITEIVPESVTYVGEVIEAIVDQLRQESSELYDIARAHRDGEPDDEPQAVEGSALPGTVRPSTSGPPTGLQPPSELRRALELLQMRWPGVDEEKVAAWADDWRALAREVRAIDLRRAVRDLARRNEGPQVDAFVAHVDERGSAVRRYRELSQGCEALAKACRAISQIVLALKIAVIEQLSTLLVSVAAATATGGPGAAGVVAAKRAATEAVQQLLEDAAAELLAE